MAAQALEELAKRTPFPIRPRREAWIAGLLAGLSHLGWMILVVLAADLLLFEGRVELADRKDAEYVAELTGRSGLIAGATVLDTGMLPAVVKSRGRWSHVFFEWTYRSLPTVRRNLAYLGTLLLGALALGLFRIAVSYFQCMAIIRATGEAVANLQRALFLHKFTLGNQAFHPEMGSRLSALLREDVPKVHIGWRAALEVLPREPARVGVCLAFALLLNPYLGAAFMLLALLVWIVGSTMLDRALRRRRELAGKADAQLDRLRGLADKLRLIKGYAADKYFQKHYGTHLDQHREDTAERLRYEARVAPVWQGLTLLLMLMIFGLAAQNVLTDRFGLAGAAGVIACLISVAAALGVWLRHRRGIVEADGAARRIQQFLAESALQAQIDGTLFLPSLADSVEFERVAFRDPVGRMLLDDLSCVIPAGKRTALLATDAEEARALVDLLNRFIEPARGSVKFDGQDLRASTMESLRAQVCLVLQTDLLFPDTVANNIGCGDPGFTREKIVEAAKVAHAHNFSERLPHGYECVVGERGFPLKAGERYRIALARAILRDPPVVVLDEPSEPLDPDTDSVLDDTYARFLHDRTAIIIPQRLATLQMCDYVLVLDKGKATAAGTHAELYGSNPVYRFLLLTRFHRAIANGA